METSKSYKLLLFGITTVFWSFIISLINMFFIDSHTLEIALDIMLTLANLIFLFVLIDSWRIFMRNTKNMEQKQQEVYEKIIEIKTDNVFMKELIDLAQIQKPITFKKERRRMTIITIIGAAACSLSIVSMAVPYIY